MAHLAIISCTVEGHNLVSLSLAIEEDSRFRAVLRIYPLADILPTRQKAVGRGSCSARPAGQLWVGGERGGGGAWLASHAAAVDARDARRRRTGWRSRNA